MAALTPLEIRARHDVALTVIREAGAIALDYWHRRDTIAVSSKGLHDVVTEADAAVEAFIRERVAAAFPEDGFLGEESGGSAVDADRPLWIVDPIDGTQEFARGTRTWCVVIALVESGATRFGVILDPNHDELFDAMRGEGATLDGRPIRVSTATSLRDGVVTVEYSSRLPKQDVLDTIGRLIDGGGTFVRGGSGALGLCGVACGRSIGFVESFMNAWDCVAAMLIIDEAGGRTNDFQPTLLSGGPVVAAAPGVWDEVAALL